MVARFDVPSIGQWSRLKVADPRSEAEGAAGQGE